MGCAGTSGPTSGCQCFGSAMPSGVCTTSATRSTQPLTLRACSQVCSQAALLPRVWPVAREGEGQHAADSVRVNAAASRH